MEKSIFECQLGISCRPTDDSTQEGYSYIGKREGLHLFKTREGKMELFARKLSCASWHLKRGAYNFEFVRSL